MATRKTKKVPNPDGITGDRETIYRGRNKTVVQYYNKRGEPGRELTIYKDTDRQKYAYGKKREEPKFPYRQFEREVLAQERVYGRKPSTKKTKKTTKTKTKSTTTKKKTTTKPRKDKADEYIVAKKDKNGRNIYMIIFTGGATPKVFGSRDKQREFVRKYVL